MTTPGSAEEQARGIALDILEKWNDRGWLFRMDFDDQLKFLTPELIRLLTTHAREARRLALEEAAGDAQHNAVYGDPRGKPREYDKGWSDASFRIAEAIRARAQASEGAAK